MAKDYKYIIIINCKSKNVSHSLDDKSIGVSNRSTQKIVNGIKNDLIILFKNDFSFANFE